MRRYYTRTFFGMGLVFCVLTAAAIVSNSAAGDAKRRFGQLKGEDHLAQTIASAERNTVARIEAAMKPVRQFSEAWKPHSRLSEKEAADRIRSEIETIAQRQLGLVTDSAITPQPERYLFQGVPVRVQRVTLRSSGKDLTALVTWLGKVEERFPAAIIEHCDFTSNVGGNTGLTIRLVHPLHETVASRASLAIPPRDPTLLPQAIAAQPWQTYLPARVKMAIPVGFTRNPLQPAVSTDSRPLPLVRDERDELTPRIEEALEGRVRSVIRGAMSVVVIDGRMFRVGDEITLGANREKPIAGAKTKLKSIGEDQLLLHISGRSAEEAVQCDVAYVLPPFLKAR